MISFLQWWQGKGLDEGWTVGAPLPLGRFESATAVVEGKLYVCGGFTRATPFWHSSGPHSWIKSTSRVDVYIPEQDKWQQLPDMPIPVTHINVAVMGHELWFAGGFVGDHPGPVTDQVWKFDLHNHIWSRETPLPEPRGGGGLQSVGESLYYFGGFASDRDTTCGDCWKWSKGQWQACAPLPDPRGHVASLSLNGLIYAVGGQHRHDTRPKDVSSVGYQ